MEKSTANKSKSPNFLSGEEDCERQFQLNTTRDNFGRCCSKITFKENPELGSSKGRAIGWLLQMEKQLAKELLIKEQYCETMRNAELNGYMEKVPTIEDV